MTKSVAVLAGVLVFASGCGAPVSHECADTCLGCCASVACVAGVIDVACGSGGASCADCTKTGQQCRTLNGTNALLCMSPPGGSGGGGGSSGVGGGGASTGAGGGSVCAPTKSCASSGLACGDLYTGCGTVSCGTCVAPKTCMGGVCDQTLYVTLRYQYASPGYVMCPGGSNPSSGYTPPVCSSIKTMTGAIFNSFRLGYAACNTTQTGSDSWTVDCTGHCTWQQTQCFNQSTQQYDPRIMWNCTIPPSNTNISTCTR